MEPSAPRLALAYAPIRGEGLPLPAEDAPSEGARRGRSKQVANTPLTDLAVREIERLAFASFLSTGHSWCLLFGWELDRREVGRSKSVWSARSREIVIGRGARPRTHPRPVNVYV